MKRKIFAVIAGLVILAGSIAFSVNQQNNGDSKDIEAKNVAALAANLNCSDDCEKGGTYDTCATEGTDDKGNPVLAICIGMKPKPEGDEER